MRTENSLNCKLVSVETSDIFLAMIFTGINSGHLKVEHPSV